MSEPEFTDVMVDTESTGTNPDRNAIIQISAVKFNLEKGTVCPNFFDRCLQIMPHRCWDEDTRKWWSGRPAVIGEIFKRAEPPKVVLEDFANWAYQTPSLRFWAKPTTFDYMFVQSHMKDAGIINPFHYRRVTDMRSFLDGLFHDEGGLKDGYEGEVEFSGDMHNALADTLHQLKILFHFVEKAKQKGLTNAV